MGSLERKILRCKKRIIKSVKTLDHVQAIHYLNTLSTLPMTVQLLAETGIGRTVNSLRKADKGVGELAKELVDRWTDMINSNSNSDSEESLKLDKTNDNNDSNVIRSEVMSMVIDNNISLQEQCNLNETSEEERQSKDFINQHKSKSSSRLYHYDSNDKKESARVSDVSKDNGHHEQKKKHQNKSESSSGSSSPSYNEKQHSSKSNKRKAESNSEETSRKKSKVLVCDSTNNIIKSKDIATNDDKVHLLSTNERDAAVKDRHKVSSHKREKTQSNEHSNSNHQSTSSNSKSNRQSTSGNSKSNQHRSSSSSSKSNEHHSSSKSNEHHSSSSSKSNEHHSSSSSKTNEHHSSGSSSKTNEPHSSGSSSKSNEHHRSGSSSKSNEHHSSGSSSKSNEHHSSGSSSKSNEHHSSGSSSKSNEHHSSGSGSKSNEHHSSGSSSKSNEHHSSGRSSKSNEHHSSGSSSKSNEHHSSGSSSKSNEHHSSGSSSKSREHSSNKSKSHESTKDKSSDERKKEDRHKNSHSSSHGKSEKTKILDKSDVQKAIQPKEKKSIQYGIDGSIDSMSGASFADALGMCSVPPPKKKKIVSPLPRKIPSPTSCPSEHKLAALPPGPITSDDLAAMSRNLPEPSQSYKPLPQINSAQRRADEEAMLAQVINAKVQRTKVYSGNKTSSTFTIPSLQDLCIQVLINNMNDIEFTGGVPFDVLKPVIERADAKQLAAIEKYNPYIMEESDYLWEFHCKKHFRNKQRRDNELWRDFYERCERERDDRLKRVTASIKQSIDKSAPVRVAKLAYVDHVVKPPRNVLKQQAKFGTGQTTTSASDLKKQIITGTVTAKSEGNSAASTSTKTNRIIVPPPPVSRAKVKKAKAPLMAKALQAIKGRYRR